MPRDAFYRSKAPLIRKETEAMTMIKILIGGAGLAAIAAATPAASQYYPYRGYNSYGYGMNTSAAASQCTAAVQNRLYSRGSTGGILGSLFGIGGTYSNARVLNVTQVRPLGNGMVRVRGLASSGRYAYNDYGPYGVGAYGAYGHCRRFFV
jgi:hypothetical protein